MCDQDLKDFQMDIVSANSLFIFLKTINLFYKIYNDVCVNLNCE